MPKTPEPDSPTSDMGSEREKFIMDTLLEEIRPDRAKRIIRPKLFRTRLRTTPRSPSPSTNAAPTTRSRLFGTRLPTTLRSPSPSMTAVPASSAENSTRTERTTMADNPSATNPAAAGVIVQHFETAQAARHHLNEDVPRWRTPLESPGWSDRPTNPSSEYAYVRAAVHSISVGLQDAALAYTPDPTVNHTNFTAETRYRVEARAWLLFDALKRLHDGGCMLRPSADFSDNFGGELGDRKLGFRERWVAVCKLLQRFGSAAGMVASGSTEEILEAYVAAPLAMGRKMEEDERLVSEGREEKKLKLAPLSTPKSSPTLKRLPPIKSSSSDEQEAREEKKRKLNLEPSTSDDLAESSEDEVMKDQKVHKAKLEHWLKDYI